MIAKLKSEASLVVCLSGGFLYAADKDEQTPKKEFISIKWSNLHHVHYLFLPAFTSLSLLFYSQFCSSSAFKELSTSAGRIV
jgi:hypothetical protein